MMRLVGGVIAGVVAWIALVTLLNLGLRHGWPAYAALEGPMLFTLPMMAARLAMSATSSLAGGFAAAWIEKGRRAPLGSGMVLLLLFIPQHYLIWDRFPLWYHLTFLASLPLLGWIGGNFWRPAAESQNG